MKKTPEMARASEREQQAVKNAINAAKSEMGAGWEHIGPTLRKALVAYGVLAQISAMDTETVSAGVASMIIGIASAAMKVEV